MNNKIVLTGVRGFVGTNLKKYLSQKTDFILVGASRDKYSLKTSSAYLDDICSYDEIYKGTHEFDAYVHLAGKVIGVNNKGENNDFFEVNYEQTKRVFDRFANDPSAKKFIFISTIHVLTEKPQGVLDEEYKPQPFTPYGKSKFLAENYIKENCPDGKKYYILRPSMIHGPGNKGNLNLLYALISKGLPYPIGKVNNKRSFVSIENFSFIIKEILSNDINAGLYHIADDEPTYTHDLIQLIATELNMKPKIININLNLLKFAAKLGNYLPIPINEYRLQKLTGDFVVSNEKIKEEIRKPLPITATEGLRRTIKSFVKNS
ncbi:NAD-dependent epimerase/dehydratase family protein [Rhodohalobacter sulfatireducens]|uniref:NAD-dependent epimerase/dehydratase family protein n=1 Tax=Rhodohalobacter sulfatireducens TaxID=2911366 RepID=A0ABS9KIZ4_9BACT|nr:NAD-dependent epimerase/dehydratase family protein [Rhodohalobacter sulfatireducens]MCG2590817.1 NAD-dependent epimerase/dehydratase family protein [Rhodohalobacter sulfatireducens]